MSTTKPPTEALVPIALEELANVQGAAATSDQMSQVLTQIQTSISTLNKNNSGGFSSTDMMLLMMVMMNGGGGFGGYGGYGYGSANVIVHGGGGFGGWPGGFVPGGCGGCCGCCGW